MGPRLVENRPGNRLSYPPAGIGGKFVALCVVKTKNSPHQPEVAFLNQISKRESLVHVALGDRNNEPEVGPDHGILGHLDRPAVGLHLCLQFKQFPFLGIFLRGAGNIVAHEIELLLLGLQGRITLLPEIYTLAEQLHLLDLGGILPLWQR